MYRLVISENEALLPFVERLDTGYYHEINSLCEVARNKAERLQELEVHQATSSYVSLCIKLIAEIQHYVSIKKQHFLPYVRTLFEKSATGHNCSTCTDGGCGMQHAMQLTELTQAHIQLKDMLNRLQMVSLPLYSETIYPDIYRILRNNMALLENSLSELFLLEETFLIPKVKEAQSNINVRD